MRTLLVILFVLSVALLGAQNMNPWANLSHSSVDANGKVHLRWMDIPDYPGTTECFYKTGTGAWNSVVTSVPEPGTMEALVPYTFGQRMRYRLHYTTVQEGQEISLLHAAYFDTDTFPPNVNNMAYVSTDPAGDLVMGTSTNMDIRETYAAATANKLYFTMKNVSGLFPTMNSFTSYNAYMCNIVNAESAMSDSITFAMVYATVPVLLSSGLYKVGYDEATQLPTFARIGNIQAQVSGGALHLACNFADLAADPDFGAWPNEYNGLALAAATMSATISTTTTLDTGDYSTPAGVLYIDNVYEVAVNHPPVVNFMSYMPETGIVSFNYVDQDGDFPLIAEVSNSDNIVVQAYPLDPMLMDSNWVAQLPIGEQGTITWHFSDNGFTVVTGQVTPSAAEDELLLPTPITCQMPNPFKPNSTISLKGLDSSPVKVSVFNLRGQNLGEIYAGVTQSQELSFSWAGKPASGIYFLRIEQGNRTINTKFVIAK